MAMSLDTLVKAGNYELDGANTRIGFAARYAMVTTVHGGFADFQSEVHLGGADLTDSTVAVTVATASIDTGQAQRDDHLRSPDFLDVASYPQMLYRSTEVTVTAPDRYLVCGALTVRGVTRPLELNFVVTGTSSDAAGRELVGFTGSGVFSRADFGLTWNALLETGGVLVGDEVVLQLDVTMIRTPAAAAKPKAGPGRWTLFGFGRSRREQAR